MPPVKRYIQGPTRLQLSYERALKRRRGTAASVIQKAYRSGRLSSVQRSRNLYRKKALMQTGESPNTYPCVVFQSSSDGFTGLPDNNLNGSSVVGLDRKSLTNMDLNTRDSDVIYLAGIKIDCTVQLNVTRAIDTNYYFNIALVSSKSGTSGVTTADFFTSGAGTNRSSNFDNVALSPHERHTLPINSDNYVVHWHQRGMIYSDSLFGDTTIGNMPRTFRLSKYCPINRQIRYDSATGNAETPIWLVHWVGKVGDAAADPVVTTNDVYDFERNVLVYFRNP